MFINLRIFSHYSVGESIVRAEELAEYCFHKNIPALAITDHNNLFSSLQFSLECQKQGVQPIMGIIINILMTIEEIEECGEMLILAKNNLGYENLMALISDAYLDYTNKPYVSLNNFIHNCGDLVILCGTNNSMLQRILCITTEKKNNQFINKIKSSLKKDLYLELIRVSKENNYELDSYIKILASNKKIPIVATNPTYYIEENMRDTLDCLFCVSKSISASIKKRHKAPYDGYIKNTKQMKEIFFDIPEAVDNSELIAKKCTFLLYGNRLSLPGFVPTSTGECSLLISTSLDGLKDRTCNLAYKGKDKMKYSKRLMYEVAIINQMTFPGYFLIVSNFIRWSRDQYIPVGPGRGSGAGAIVAWTLGVSDINPIKFRLLFERFLNPDRISMPDFDIDFCQDRRDEVIEFVRTQFGGKSVGAVLTFGKLQSKAVLRDIGRSFKIPYYKVDRICKRIPNNLANPATLQESIGENNRLKVQSGGSFDLRKLVSTALKLEGMTRNVSTHAAGVVIGSKVLKKITGLYKDSDVIMSTIQYGLQDAEGIGLVKFDFLGLKTLTTVSWVVSLIKANGKNFNLEDFPIDDNKTFNILGSGRTIGIFQFEGYGIKESLRKMQPDSIRDLVALVSLYRPGPMKYITTYVKRKHGIEKIHYAYHTLEGLLRETYGIIIYQEQVMEMAQILANYSLAEADILRRAIGKKVEEEIIEQKKKFMHGCKINDINPVKSEELFRLVKKFASYGFNKSHAATYSYISFQTAYLKANYTIEFITTSINLEIEDMDKLYEFMVDARRLGVDILLPDINCSKSKFTIQNNKIRFGLAAIKSVGADIIDLVVVEREKNGRYRDIFDLIERLPSASLNKKLLENLIKSGAFDGFYMNRRTLVHNISVIMNSVTVYEDYFTNQLDLFFGASKNLISKPSIEILEDSNEKTQLKNEMQALGYHISSIPLQRYKCFLSKLNIYKSNDLAKIRAPLSHVQLIGVLLKKKVRSTPEGKYAFLQIVDLQGALDAAIFDERLIYNCSKMLIEGDCLCFTIQIKKNNFGVKMVIKQIKTIKQIAVQSKNIIKVTINNIQQLEYLKKRINYFSGVKVKIIIKLQSQSTVHVKHKKCLFIDFEEFSNLQDEGMIDM